MSQASPIWSTGMIAFVRFVIRFSTSAGSALKVRGSISQKTTVAPV